MMEPLPQSRDPLDEPQPATPTEAKGPPRALPKPTRRNYWAKLDPRDFARFPAVPPLTYLEESRLFGRAQNGDLDARNALWRQYLRLTFSVVNRFRLPPSLLADAIQEAAMGLGAAIDRFEVHRYLAFSTYAWFWMEQRVRRFLHNNRYSAHLPGYLHAEYNRFRKGLRRCRSDADWFDWREEWLSSSPRRYKHFSWFHRLAHARPLDDAVDLACRVTDPAPAFERAEILALVRTVVDRLPAREAYIIVRRYGLDGEPTSTLKEIGREVRLTRERVRQLETVALDRIRPDLQELLAGETASVWRIVRDRRREPDSHTHATRIAE